MPSLSHDGDAVPERGPLARLGLYLYAVLLCYPIWLIARSIEYWWTPDVGGIDLAWLDFSDESPDGMTTFQKLTGFGLWVIVLPLLLAGKLLLW